MASLTKQELINGLSVKMGLTLSDAREAVEFMVGKMKVALVDGRKVEIRGFGVLRVSRRAQRVGRIPCNIAAGPCVIPARNVVKFKVGAELDEALNNESQGSLVAQAQQASTA